MLVRILKRTFGGVEYGPEQKVLKLGGRGSAEVQRLEFSLPEDWDGMEVTLHVEREDGSVPEPALLDRENGVKVDGRFTACRSGLWMLMAVDGQGYRAMTKPEKYICHETLQMGEALEGMPAPLLPLYYQYAQRTMEDALAAQQAAQQAARAAESLCPDRVQLMRMLEGMSYAAPDMAAVHAELRQSWMDKIPDQPDTVPVERIRLDRVVLQMKAGESTVLTARIWPENATDKTVHWMVQPEGVAEVQDGKVTAVQKGAALITGTTVDIRQVAAYSNVIGNDVLEEVMDKNLDHFIPIGYTEEELAYAGKFKEVVTELDKEGLKDMIAHAVEKDKRKEVLDMPLLDFKLDRSESYGGGGSTDVGDVSWVVPTVQTNVCCYAAGTALHSWQAVAQGKASIAHKGMLTAAKVMACTGADLLENPELIKKAHKDWLEELDGETYPNPLPKDAKPELW